MYKKTYPTTYDVYINGMINTENCRESNIFLYYIIWSKNKIYIQTVNLTVKINIDKVFGWRLILKENSPEIEYIPGEKNIVAGDILIFTINGNQQTTHDSNE